MRYFAPAGDPVHTILVVDDNVKLTALIGRDLARAGYQVCTASTTETAISHLSSRKINLILLDLVLGSERGLDALEAFRNIDASVPVVMMTGYGSIESAVESIKRGAYDYLQKPVDFTRLLNKIEKALEFASLKSDTRLLRRQVMKMDSIFNTRSARMLELIEKARRLAHTELPVLITGESGTGKELLAEFIHENSPRSSRQLVKINSASFPESLLDNELFGHERNAFTGAVSLYKGVFEQSHNGTLFLDEIGDMPPEIQAKILRAIHNKEIRRIGGSQTITIDVRFLAATNKDISRMVEEGRFRDDLFFRVNTAQLHMPSLHERQEDIPLLCRHFLEQFGQRQGDGEVPLPPDTEQVLLSYRWPGNVRELKNVLQYATAVSRTGIITPADLPPYLVDGSSLQAEGTRSGSGEKERLLGALRDSLYNKKRAAELLGVSRKTLYKKLAKHGI